jgi:hypothetical protein
MKSYSVGITMTKAARFNLAELQAERSAASGK